MLGHWHLASPPVLVCGICLTTDRYRIGAPLTIRKLLVPQLEFFRDDNQRQRVALQSVMFDSQRDLAECLSLHDNYDKHVDFEQWDPTWAFKYQPASVAEHSVAGDTVREGQ